MNIKLLPDIEKYLETLDTIDSPSIEGLDDIINRVVVNTGHSKEVVEIVLKMYLQELRNTILRGEIACHYGFGNFYLSSPKNGNKVQVFVKFKQSKKLTRLLNDRLKR